MGVHANISYEKFPRQGAWLGARVKVCFNYDEQFIGGEIVRDDAEEPCCTVIKLDDGRYVLATECQYALAGDAPAPAATAEAWPDTI